jgi:hypothetical protein
MNEPIEPASVMCTLCGFARTVETSTTSVDGLSSALEFAVHFAAKHPEVQKLASKHIVMVPVKQEGAQP